MNAQELKAAILASKFERTLTPVNVPQWPATHGKLFIRNLTALEDEKRADVARRSMSDPKVCYAAELVALLAVDKDGVRAFEDPADVLALANGSPDPLDYIGGKYMETLRAAGEAPGKSEANNA